MKTKFESLKKQTAKQLKQLREDIDKELSNKARLAIPNAVLKELCKLYRDSIDNLFWAKLTVPATKVLIYFVKGKNGLSIRPNQYTYAVSKKDLEEAANKDPAVKEAAEKYSEINKKYAEFFDSTCKDYKVSKRALKELVSKNWRG